jgi:CopG family nickel-responsive transcriptional regulator
MSELIRFGVSIEEPLLAEFDLHIQNRAYTNRSEAIRDLIRRELSERECEQSDCNALGTITLIYDHHVQELPKALMEIQHLHCHKIISTMHVHLNEHACLEVLAVEGIPRELQQIADKLISMKGVKHGKLVMSTLETGHLHSCH